MLLIGPLNAVDIRWGKFPLIRRHGGGWREREREEGTKGGEKAEAICCREGRRRMDNRDYERAC
jgi:hypothetical protein